jgi:hypothetical protein
MLRLTTLVIVFAVTFLAATVARGQTTKRDEPCSELRFLPLGTEAPTITATDVRNLPQCFNGKFIEMVGVYRVFFENSDLYDPTGGDQRTWVSFDPYYSAVKRCSSSSAMHLLDRKKGGTFGFTALGILRRGGGYGHMNGWANELQVICVETVVDFSDSGAVFDYQKPDVRKRILDWYAKQH